MGPHNISQCSWSSRAEEPSLQRTVALPEPAAAKGPAPAWRGPASAAILHSLRGALLYQGTTIGGWKYLAKCYMRVLNLKGAKAQCSWLVVTVHHAS